MDEKCEHIFASMGFMRDMNMEVSVRYIYTTSQMTSKTGVLTVY